MTVDTKTILAITAVALIAICSFAAICQYDEADADGLSISSARYYESGNEVRVILSDTSASTATFTVKDANGIIIQEFTGKSLSAKQVTLTLDNGITTGGYKVFAKGSSIDTWAAIKAQITYCKKDMSTYKVEDAEIGSDLIAGPKESGFVFENWKNSGTIFEKATGTMTVYAQYKEATDHTITVVVADPNYGTASSSKDKAKYDDIITLTVNPSSGYVFKKWESSDVTITNNQFTMPDKNVEVTATFERAYTITYILDGGTNNPGNPSTYLKSNPVVYKEPTKTGYTFCGWFSDSNLTNSVNGTADYVAGTDVKAYAKWSLTEYSIGYALYGGSLSDEAPKKYTIESNTIVLMEPTKTDNRFLGWYRESTFTNKVTEIPKGSTGNIDLHARWSGDYYVIDYKLYGGTNYAGAPDFYPENTDNITLGTPTKTGYTFKGWFLEKEYIHEIKVITKDTKSDLTLHAKWSPTTYSISYKTDGGTMSGGTSTYTIESDAITLPTPVKNHYTFKGWYDNAGLSGSPVEMIPKGSYGDKTFYAKWSEAEYKITYVLNGGQYSGAPSSYTYFSPTVDLGKPTKSDSVFAGWFSNAEFTGDPVAFVKTGSEGDKTFYAKWTTGAQYSINVTYDSAKGTASANLDKATKDTTIVLTAYPKNGYVLDKWVSSDVSIDGNKFTMPSKPVTVQAVFIDSTKIFTVTVEVNDTALGSVNLTKVMVYEGTTFSASGNTLVFSDGQKVTATAKSSSIYGKANVLKQWSRTSGTITDNSTKITALFETQNEYDNRSVSSDNGFKVSGNGIRYDAKLEVASKTYSRSDWPGIDSEYTKSSYEHLVYEIGLSSPTGTARVGGSGSLTLTLPIDSEYNGKTAVIYHKEGSSIKNLGSSQVSGGKASIITDSLSPFLVILPRDIPVTGVSLDVGELRLTVGDGYTFKVTVTPEDAAITTVTWRSDDTSVATIDSNGRVTAVSAGTAIIIVTTDDGGKTDTCTITVENNNTVLIISIAVAIIIVIVAVIMLYMRRQNNMKIAWEMTKEEDDGNVQNRGL